MHGRVPIARRNLFQDRRRAGLAVAGVAAALVLVLVLNGIFAGAMRQVTAYIDSSPADVFVSQAGVRTMHMSATSLPDGTLERVQNVDGVAWADPLRYTTGVVAAGDARVITYVLGYEPAGHAGPRTIVEGEPPSAGEAVVDEQAAAEIGVGVGDEVEILGVPLVVSGLSSGGTNLVNTSVFLHIDQFAELRGPGTNYVLVGAEPGLSGDELADRVAREVPDATVQTREQFSEQEASIVRDMATDIMAIMTVIGFLIALAVVALTLFTATLSKIREYGILKAIGGTTAHLGATVLSQALITVLLATAIAVVVAYGVGAAVGAATPNVRVSIELSSIARTAAGAVVVGLVAALIPLRRVVAVDPASAFRKAS